MLKNLARAGWNLVPAQKKSILVMQEVLFC